MEQQTITRQVYVYPTIEAIKLEIGSLMVEISGQHNPAEYGGVVEEEDGDGG
ncbi:hypothetical protein [Alloprevotella tannerae]|jgi:hypothetical protein|uniref:hypothetical protein n=1 Tax=Alloprevotella tannerae TaxID=76122 RepID=UPI001EDC0EF2|nr:hypothetical protein [Alloprevotella tannerae]MCG2653598.1 hypothetical protein [Alloprevotella tannerae]